MHVGRDDEVRHCRVLPALLHHEARDDAYGPATGFHTSFGRGGHEARASCPVDEAVAAPGHRAAQLAGQEREGL